jgi:hypothetical protein
MEDNHVRHWVEKAIFNRTTFVVIARSSFHWGMSESCFKNPSCIMNHSYPKRNFQISWKIRRIKEKFSQEMQNLFQSKKKFSNLIKN